MDLEQELRDYLVRNHLPDEEGLQDGEDLIAGGLLDSLGIARLTEHLEERHGVRLGAEDFSMSNFSTVAGLAALIRRKQGRAREAEIFSICARVLSRPSAEIGRATRLVEELGASSLDLMQIAQSIEKEWGIVLSESDLFLFGTAGDLAAAAQAAPSRFE